MTAQDRVRELLNDPECCVTRGDMRKLADTIAQSNGGDPVIYDAIRTVFGA